MGFHAEILADSVGPDGQRITTFLRRYPHAVHKDLLRHNAHNFSYQSMRAYPSAKLFEILEDDPFIPERFEEYMPGMNVGNGVSTEVDEMCRAAWLDAKDAAVASAKKLIDAGVNKGHANILVQDFCWITGIVTATEWGNFWALRADPPSNAKPRAEVIKIAKMMRDLYDSSTPKKLDYGQPHLPLIRSEDSGEVASEFDEATWMDAEQVLIEVATGRSARTSYLTHDGVRDMSADIGLHDNLLENHHMSPFAHVAWPIPLTGHKYVEAPDPRVGKVMVHGPDWRDKYYGWCSYRQTIPYQYDMMLAVNDGALPAS